MRNDEQLNLVHGLGNKPDAICGLTQNMLTSILYEADESVEYVSINDTPDFSKPDDSDSPTATSPKTVGSDDDEMFDFDPPEDQRSASAPYADASGMARVQSPDFFLPWQSYDEALLPAADFIQLMQVNMQGRLSYAHADSSINVGNVDAVLRVDVCFVHCIEMLRLEGDLPVAARVLWYNESANSLTFDPSTVLSRQKLDCSEGESLPIASEMTQPGSPSCYRGSSFFVIPSLASLAKQCRQGTMKKTVLQHTAEFYGIDLQLPPHQAKKTNHRYQLRITYQAGPVVNTSSVVTWPAPGSGFFLAVEAADLASDQFTLYHRDRMEQMICGLTSQQISQRMLHRWVTSAKVVRSPMWRKVSAQLVPSQGFVNEDTSVTVQFSSPLHESFRFCFVMFGETMSSAIEMNRDVWRTRAPALADSSVDADEIEVPVWLFTSSAHANFFNSVVAAHQLTFRYRRRPIAHQFLGTEIRPQRSSFDANSFSPRSFHSQSAPIPPTLPFNVGNNDASMVIDSINNSSLPRPQAHIPSRSLKKVFGPTVVLANEAHWTLFRNVVKTIVDDQYASRPLSSSVPSNCSGSPLNTLVQALTSEFSYLDNDAAQTLSKNEMEDDISDEELAQLLFRRVSCSPSVGRRADDMEKVQKKIVKNYSSNRNRSRSISKKKKPVSSSSPTVSSPSCLSVDDDEEEYSLEKEQRKYSQVDLRTDGLLRQCDLSKYNGKFHARLMMKLQYVNASSQDHVNWNDIPMMDSQGDLVRRDPCKKRNYLYPAMLATIVTLPPMGQWLSPGAQLVSVNVVAHPKHDKGQQAARMKEFLADRAALPFHRYHRAFGVVCSQEPGESNLLQLRPGNVYVHPVGHYPMFLPGAGGHYAVGPLTSGQAGTSPSRDSFMPDSPDGLVQRRAISEPVGSPVQRSGMLSEYQQHFHFVHNLLCYEASQPKRFRAHSGVRFHVYWFELRALIRDGEKVMAGRVRFVARSRNG